MTHPFHTGRDARYTGAATIPNTGGRGVTAAALVLQHPLLKVQIDPMYRSLDVCPSRQTVESFRLVPITAVDFFPRRDALPDLHPLGPEEHAIGTAEAGAEYVRAGAAVGVSANGADLPTVRAGAGGCRRGARGMEGST